MSEKLWATPKAADAERGERGDLLTQVRGYKIAHAGTAERIDSQPSMFSVEDFPVSPTPLLANVADLRTRATSGPSSPDSFASLGPDGSWRKTCQGYSQMTLDGSLEAFSETWPRAGMTQSGRAFLLPTWERRIDAIEYGSSLTQTWATPSSRDWKDSPGMAQTGTNPDGSPRQRVDQLARQVYARQWPTPTAITNSGGAALCKRGGSGARQKLRGMVTPAELNGQLNPTWVEWLMGYPLGWTDCGDSATPSSRKSRSGSSTASKRRKLKGED
jgi:hypothetical protein